MATNEEEDLDLDDEDLDDEENGGDGDKSGKGKDGKGDNGTQKRKPETPEARKTRLDRQTEQHRKKHPELYKAKDETKEPKAGDEKETKLDYGQLAFLSANDIKADDEQALAQQIAAETGKELKDVIKGAYFKSELKALREENAAKDALPDSKRSKASSPQTVEYWVEKGGLPPATADNRKLREDIVNARIKKGKAANQFTDHALGNVS